jgi:sugar O-acyltransferase (sialic acid O-acetyltransferase NeuD family)
MLIDRLPDRAMAVLPKPGLLLFGAGGHARVVLDAATRSGQWGAVLACDRNDAVCTGELLPGVAILKLPGLPAALGQTGALHVSIGHNASRQCEAVALGLERLVTVVHPEASVSPHAVVAAGCFIAAQSVLAPGAQLGTGVIINHAAVVDHDVRVGDFSHVAPGAVLGGAAKMGARVLIGAGAVVLPGVSVCDDAVIGAGAVVSADVLTPGTWVGVPARRLK